MQASSEVQTDARQSVGTMTTTRLTADDLLAMGGDCRCELVNGELTPMRPSSYLWRPHCHVIAVTGAVAG
jgi:hypothetical protein